MRPRTILRPGLATGPPVSAHARTNGSCHVVQRMGRPGTVCPHWVLHTVQADPLLSQGAAHPSPLTVPHSHIVPTAFAACASWAAMLPGDVPATGHTVGTSPTVFFLAGVGASAPAIRMLCGSRGFHCPQGKGGGLLGCQTHFTAPADIRAVLWINRLPFLPVARDPAEG